MSIKAGDRVLFTGELLKYGNNTFISFFKENKVYGVVGDQVIRGKYNCPSGYTLVMYDSSFPIYKDTCTIQMYEAKDVTAVAPEDYVESDRCNVAAANRVKALMLAIPIKCKTEPTLSYPNRIFRFGDLQDLDTNHSYAMVGTWDSNGNWTNIQRQYRPQCCAFTKMKNDVKVWIPKVWLNYYGYTMYDLAEYLKFLSKCDIGFKYEFLGEEDLDPNFDESVGTSTGLREQVFVGKYASIINQDGKKGFVCVKLKGSQYVMETYMRFICLRYMYNMKYWTIPGHAMQIKKTLGALVTNMEALMLAHLHTEYYGYYCFVDQKARNPNSAHYLSNDLPMHTASNYDRYIDPYQSMEEVMNKLRSGNYQMNSSFVYTKDKYERKELDKFFANQDWLGLYKYTKENRNK